VGHLTYEPQRLRINHAWIALISCATPGVIVSFAIGSPWRYLTASLALAAALWSVRRAFRIGLIVTREGVTICNYWRSHVISWSDVDAVGIALKQVGVLPQPALGFRRRSGPPVFAQATPVRQSERREFQSAVLSFAPSSVQTLKDTAGIIGSDRAPSNLLRLWWLRRRKTG
jgi:hypothetical protein